MPLQIKVHVPNVMGVIALYSFKPKPLFILPFDTQIRARKILRRQVNGRETRT